MWTLETPMVGGWYWCHLYRAGRLPFPILLVVRDGETLVAGPAKERAADWIARWSGPIHPPELP